VTCANIHCFPSSVVVTATRVSAATDRPARRRCSAHAKYSVSHHIVIKPFLLLGLAAEYRSRRWVWSTVVRRPSSVYDTHRRTKLPAPETISRSSDIVGAHQNLNGSRDLTTPYHAPFQRWFAIHKLALATVSLSTKFDASNSTHYEDTKGDTKCRQELIRRWDSERELVNDDIAHT